MPGIALYKLADLSVVLALLQTSMNIELPFYPIGAAGVHSIILYPWRDIHRKSNLYISFSQSGNSNCQR